MSSCVYPFIGIQSALVLSEARAPGTASFTKRKGRGSMIKATRRIYSRSTKILALVGLSIVPAAQSHAQSSPVPVSPPTRNHDGWSVRNVNASFGYSAVALPNSSSALAFSLERLEGDYDGT